MPNYTNLRAYFLKWSNYTFEQGINFSKRCNNNEALKQQTIKILQQQNLLNKKMDGNSVQDLPRKYEGENTYVRYAEVFSICMNNYLTPAEYIICTVEKLMDANVDERLMLDVVGRAYRAFPSFIREYDLEYQLAKTFGSDNVTHSSVCEDVVGHEDVKLCYNKKDYHIWSYQMSPRGLRNTGQRIIENRGLLQKGMHVLCPIDVFSNDRTLIEGWILYPEEYGSRVKMLLDSENTDDYAEIKKLSRERLDTYMKKLQLFNKT